VVHESKQGKKAAVLSKKLQSFLIRIAGILTLSAVVAGQSIKYSCHDRVQNLLF